MTLRGSCAYEVFLTFFSFKATALVLFIVSFLIKGVILNTNLTTVEVKLGRLSIMANMWRWNWTERRNHWSNNKTILGKKQNIRYHLNLSLILHISYFSFTFLINFAGPNQPFPLFWLSFKFSISNMLGVVLGKNAD